MGTVSLNAAVPLWVVADFGVVNDGCVARALMLATLTDQRDFGDEWLLERKFDGERCLARKAGRVVELESRTGKRLTGKYPEVHAAVAAQRARGLMLDGDLVRAASAAPWRLRAVRSAGRRVPSRLLRVRLARAQRRQPHRPLVG